MNICLCGIDWQAAAALGTWFACILTLWKTFLDGRMSVKVKMIFDCYKCYHNEHVNLIEFVVINSGKNAIYLDAFGLLVPSKGFYHEVFDSEHAPFYNKLLPVCLLPGQSIHLYINTKSFCVAMQKENVNPKTKIRGYVMLSNGDVKKSCRFSNVPLFTIIGYSERTVDDVAYMRRFSESEATKS